MQVANNMENEPTIDQVKEMTSVYFHYDGWFSESTDLIDEYRLRLLCVKDNRICKLIYIEDMPVDISNNEIHANCDEQWAKGMIPDEDWFCFTKFVELHKVDWRELITTEQAKGYIRAHADMGNRNAFGAIGTLDHGKPRTRYSGW